VSQADRDKAAQDVKRAVQELERNLDAEIQTVNDLGSVRKVRISLHTSRAQCLAVLGLHAMLDVLFSMHSRRHASASDAQLLAQASSVVPCGSEKTTH
jgi:hypothetical protein